MRGRGERDIENSCKRNDFRPSHIRQTTMAYSCEGVQLTMSATVSHAAQLIVQHFPCKEHHTLINGSVLLRVCASGCVN